GACGRAGSSALRVAVAMAGGSCSVDLRKDVHGHARTVGCTHMTLQADLVQRALSLATADRAELARQLILSLKGGELDADAEALWEAEIERRSARVEGGEANLLDWRESVERIRGSLKRPEAE